MLYSWVVYNSRVRGTWLIKTWLIKTCIFTALFFRVVYSRVVYNSCCIQLYRILVHKLSKISTCLKSRVTIFRIVDSTYEVHPQDFRVVHINIEGVPIYTTLKSCVTIFRIVDSTYIVHSLDFRVVLKHTKSRVCTNVYNCTMEGAYYYIRLWYCMSRYPLFFEINSNSLN